MKRQRPHSILDTNAVMNRASALGIQLGRSDDALADRPTFEQEEAARAELGREFGASVGETAAWNVLGAGPFRSGYKLGKMDGVGARRRVAIKRAARLENEERS